MGRSKHTKKKKKKQNENENENETSGNAYRHKDEGMWYHELREHEARREGK